MLLTSTSLARQQLAHLRVRDRAAHPDAEAEQPIALGALLVGDRRPVDLELDAGELAGPRDRLEPLGGRGAPERDRPESRAGLRARRRRRRRCRSRARSGRPWSSRAGRSGARRVSTAVESRSASDERPAALPVGEPEQQRDPARAHERRGQDRVERDAVRDDRERLRLQLAAEPGHEAPARARSSSRRRRHGHGSCPAARPRRPGRRARRPRRPARRARGACRRPRRGSDPPGRPPASRRRSLARHRKSRSPSSKWGRSGTAWPDASALPSTVNVRCVGT